MHSVLVSAICPLRDEALNIPALFHSLRKIGDSTEVILVEGGSQDDSWKVATNYDHRINRHGVFFRAIKQKGSGKAGAVATGFDAARGKYLMIVDADLSVVHRELQKIYRLFGKDGDQILAVGNRLRGWRKPKAFYWLNYAGNYFFRFYFSLILQAPILDVYCGTKALTKSSWQKLKKVRQRFGLLESWGDLDWLYYGQKIGLKIKFTNIHYVPRLVGESKLQNMFVRARFALSAITIGWKIVRLNWRKNV